MQIPRVARDDKAVFRLAALIIAFLSSVAAAQQPATLSARVAREIGARWGVAPERIRLEWREPAPAAGLAFASLMPRASGWWTVVPATSNAERMIGVRAGVIDTIRVARRQLVRGVVVTDADMADSVVVRWGKPATINRTKVETGWVTRRIISAGEELRAPAVAPAPLIATGDSVQIVADGGAISLAIKAVAVRQASRAGDRLDVRLADGRTLGVIAASATTVHPISR